MGNAVRVEQPPSQENRSTIIIETKNKNKFTKSKFLGTVALGAVTALAALHAYKALSPHKETIVTPSQATVEKLIPTVINERAIVDTSIKATAVSRYHSAYEKVPGIGTFLKWQNKSYANTATFTGNNGHGGGQVATEVGVKAYGVTVQKKGNKEIINIPYKDIVLQTGIDNKNSLTVNTQGNLAAIQHAVGDLVAPLDKNSHYQRQVEIAKIGQAARQAAINQGTKCAEQYFPEVKTTIQNSYRLIAEEQYQHDIANGQHIKRLNPNNIFVHFTGPEILSNTSNQHVGYSTDTSMNSCSILPLAQQVPKILQTASGKTLPSNP